MASVSTAEQFDVVCCSLEPWDDVWRRNQFFADGLLRTNPRARILFVEVAVDITMSVAHGQRPPASRLRRLGDTGRLWAFAGRKWLPRKIWPYADASLCRQVRRAARRLGMQHPVLWVNDNTYAHLAVETGWPAVYDITDDWLLTNSKPREAARQRQNDTLMLQAATEVVVCSPALEKTRGATRPVHLITNGVDIDHFRSPRPRPLDLPAGPVVVYVGTLATGRIDVELCLELARQLPAGTSLVLVGPNHLPASDTTALLDSGVLVLGPRPYEDIPAYFQHAAVLVVPHVVNPFTESLDPIKAREIQAVGRPTVSTPVAGFRALGPPITVAGREQFVGCVTGILAQPGLAPGPGPLEEPPATWKDRAADFAAILDVAAAHGPSSQE